MPRYFFNVFDGVDIIDADGVELSSILEMRVHMMSMAMTVIEGHPVQKDAWQIEALDEHGMIVGSMEFGSPQTEWGAGSGPPLDLGASETRNLEFLRDEGLAMLSAFRTIRTREKRNLILALAQAMVDAQSETNGHV